MDSVAIVLVIFLMLVGVFSITEIYPSKFGYIFQIISGIFVFGFTIFFYGIFKSVGEIPIKGILEIACTGLGVIYIITRAVEGLSEIRKSAISSEQFPLYDRKELEEKVKNSQYKAVIIGNKIWMAENLKVDRYRNGDVIIDGSDNKDWKELQVGEFCYINNDPTTENIHGKRYNWFAVNDERGLAPVGWHIPTSAELKNLAKIIKQDGNVLFGISEGSGQVDVLNKKGYSELFGGARGSEGGFHSFGKSIGFWSSDEVDISLAFGILISEKFGKAPQLSVYLGGINKECGTAVRCVMD